MVKTYFRYYKRNDRGAVAFTQWYEDTPANRQAWVNLAEKEELKKQTAKAHHFFDLFSTPLFSKLLQELMEDKV